jgi:hypothetical protein
MNTGKHIAVCVWSVNQSKFPPRQALMRSLERNFGEQKNLAHLLAKRETRAIPLSVTESNPAVDRFQRGENQRRPKLTSDRRAQPEMAGRIFLFESAVTH